VGSGHSAVIKWMVAMRGELNVEKKGQYWENYSTIIEMNKTEVATLLERFMVNRVQVRHEARAELGFPDSLAADLFAMVIFVCDGLLKVKVKVKAGRTRRSTRRPETARFFNIVQRLPMELQMILCHAVYNSGKENSFKGF
jgi:hypothetical protein